MDKNEIIKIYKKVLNEELYQFPKGFWVNNDSKYYAKVCVEYLFLDILKFKYGNLSIKILKDLFHKYKLNGMVNIIYFNSYKTCLNKCYPDVSIINYYKKASHVVIGKQSIKEWTKEEAIEVMRIVFEDKLKWTKEDMLKNINTYVFKKNGLSYILETWFDDCIYNVVKEFYPDVKAWELSNVPRNFWNEKTAKEATRWLFEEKLKWDLNDIYENFNSKTYSDNGLSGMLNLKIYKGNCIKALKDVYDIDETKLKMKSKDKKIYSIYDYSKNVLEIYDDLMNKKIKSFPRYYWEMENRKSDASILLKHVLQKKFNNDIEAIKKNIDIKFFEKNKLMPILSRYYEYSPYVAIKSLYPDIKAWELPNVPRNFWTKEKAIEATRWLFEEKLKYNVKDIKRNSYKSLYLNNNLSSMLVLIYNNNATKAVQDAYPEIRIG